MILAVMGALAYLVASFTPEAMKARHDRQTQEALVQAREALIGYAISFAVPVPGCNPNTDSTCNNRPGDLPCPDDHALTDALAGTPGTSCGSNALGRLPDKTLGISGLTDGSSERLWYAVSTNFKNSPQTGTLNSSSTGTITIRDGSGNVVFDGSAGNGVVAVIIAPGAPLAGQDRSVAGQANPASYLDSNGSESNAVFIDGTTDGFVMGPVFDQNRNVLVNDQIITITRDELMAAIGQRVAKEALTCLAQFPVAGRAYPWPAPLTVPASNDGRTGTLFGRLPLTQENINPREQVAGAINAVQAARVTLASAAPANQSVALQQLTAQLSYLQSAVMAAYDAIVPVRDQASNTKNATTNATTNTYAGALSTAVRNAGYDAFLPETKTDYDLVAQRLAQFSAVPDYTTANNLRSAEGTLRNLMRRTSYDSVASLHFPYSQNVTVFAAVTTTYNDATTARTAATTARDSAAAGTLTQAEIDAAAASAQVALDTTDALMKTIGGYLLNTSAASMQENAANALLAAENFGAQTAKTDTAAANVEFTVQGLWSVLAALAPLPPAGGAIPAAIEALRTPALTAANTALASIQLSRSDLTNATNANQAVTDATNAFNQAAALAQAMQGQRVNIASSSVTGQADLLHGYIVSLQSVFAPASANSALGTTQQLYRIGRLLVTGSVAVIAARNAMIAAATTAKASLQTALAASTDDPQLAAKQAQAIADASALETAARALAGAISNNGDNVGLETLNYWNGVLAANLGNSTGNTAAGAVRYEATKIYNQAQTFLNNAVLGGSSTDAATSSAIAAATATTPDIAQVLTLTDTAITSAANLISSNLATAVSEAPGAVLWPKHAGCDWIKAAPPPPATNTGASWQANQWQKWIFVQLNDPAIAGNLTVNGAGSYPLIVIAPGPLLGGKTGDSTDPAHYLEAGNATGPSTKQYSTGAPSTTFNDRLAY